MGPRRFVGGRPSATASGVCAPPAISARGGEIEHAVGEDVSQLKRGVDFELAVGDPGRR
jgi:hypothetical protein